MTEDAEMAIRIELGRLNYNSLYIKHPVALEKVNAKRAELRTKLVEVMEAKAAARAAAERDKAVIIVLNIDRLSAARYNAHTQIVRLVDGKTLYDDKTIHNRRSYQPVEDDAIAAARAWIVGNGYVEADDGGYAEFYERGREGIA